MADRLIREMDTVEIMINLYCRSNHRAKDNLCTSCEELKNYAFRRLASCKYGDQKPVCGKCKVHCYRPEMRERIKAVMRKAGPKMVFRYPVITLYHLIDYFKYK